MSCSRKNNGISSLRSTALYHKRGIKKDQGEIKGVWILGGESCECLPKERIVAWRVLSKRKKEVAGEGGKEATRENVE